jgi:Flp pilus assembly protein TadD
MVRLASQDEARGRFEDAIEVLRVAAVLDPRVLAVWDGLSRCYAKVGDDSRAQSAARVAKAVRRATAKG